MIKVNDVVVIKQGDITKEKVDAIVNAANSHLAGGGGVDGAIHQAAGPELMWECKKIIADIKYLKPGNAVITGAYNIKDVKYIIHTVGPVWRGGNNGERDILRNCYKNSLELAKKHGIKTISFPSIATGVYGFPIDVAVGIVMDEVLRHTEDFNQINLVLFSKYDYDVYVNYVEKNILK